MGGSWGVGGGEWLSDDLNGEEVIISPWGCTRQPALSLQNEFLYWLGGVGGVGVGGFGVTV